MLRIFKYELSKDTEQELVLPLGAKILSVANQNETPVLYALIDDIGEMKSSFKIFTIGTGEDSKVISGMDFLGTILFQEGTIVHHYFYKKVS